LEADSSEVVGRVSSAVGRDQTSAAEGRAEVNRNSMVSDAAVVAVV